MKPAIASSFLRARMSWVSTSPDRVEHDVPALQEEGVEHLVLGAEVVVHQPVGDARLVGDVADAAGVEALAGEDADGRVEDEPALLGSGCR